MRYADEGGELACQQWHKEIAVILAAGYLRMDRERTRGSGMPSASPTDNSSRAGLDLPGETRLSVTGG